MWSRNIIFSGRQVPGCMNISSPNPYCLTLILDVYCLRDNTHMINSRGAKVASIPPLYLKPLVPFLEAITLTSFLCIPPQMVYEYKSMYEHFKKQMLTFYMQVCTFIAGHLKS